MVNLSICYQLLSSRLNKRLQSLDITMTHLSILSHFSHAPDQPITVTQLAAVMEMNQPGVTKAAKTMEEKGWLRRQKDEHDARISQLYITKRGLKMLGQAQQYVAGYVGQCFEDFSNNELKALAAHLGRLKDRLNAEKVSE